MANHNKKELFYGKILVLALVLVGSARQVPFLDKKSTISFKMTYSNIIKSNQLYSFKAIAQPHHNFSSLVTGILADYQFNETFKAVKPADQTEAAKLYMMSIDDYSSDGYLNFTKDYFKKKFKPNYQIQTCSKYFPDTEDATCQYYELEQASFSLNSQNEINNRSSFIYKLPVANEKDYTLSYENNGVINIINLMIPQRILYCIFLLLCFFIFWISLEIIRLYRKKNRTKNRIEKLKKKNK